MEYYERKEKQVDLQKKIQSSNMLNAVRKANFQIRRWEFDKFPIQARLKVLKHRDDHVASVMDEAKASLVTITRDKAKYTGILQQLLTQGVILVSYYHSASMRGVPTFGRTASKTTDTFSQGFVSCLSQRFSSVVVKLTRL